MSPLGLTLLLLIQEQTTEDVIIQNGFGTVVSSLGIQTKPYLPQICETKCFLGELWAKTCFSHVTG